jgi:hypothetical protein
MAMTEQQQHEFRLVKRRLSGLQKTLKVDLDDGQLPQKTLYLPSTYTK